MKFSMTMAIAFSAFLAGCGGGGGEKDNKDTANTLSDTFPATMKVDTTVPDSQPADALRLDTMNR